MRVLLVVALSIVPIFFVIKKDKGKREEKLDSWLSTVNFEVIQVVEVYIENIRTITRQTNKLFQDDKHQLIRFNKVEDWILNKNWKAEGIIFIITIISSERSRDW